MKGSYSPVPLKLGNLKEDPKKKSQRQFHPLFTPKVREEEAERSRKDEALEWEERIRKTFEEAYAQGEKAGYEMGMKKVEPLIKRLNNYIETIESFKEEMRKETERLALELSIIISEAIILRECSLNKEVLSGMIKKALDLCEKKREVVIRVRREDAQYITTRFPSIKVIPDETLNDVGFVIESSFGDIDGTLRTQLEEIREEILRYMD